MNQHGYSYNTIAINALNRRTQQEQNQACFGYAVYGGGRQYVKGQVQIVYSPGQDKRSEATLWLEGISHTGALKGQMQIIHSPTVSEATPWDNNDYNSNKRPERAKVKHS